MVIIVIICKEINDYIEYCQQHPNKINEDRKLLIKNIVKPTIKRSDVFFDKKTYRNCIAYCEKNFYPLFPYQKFIYAFVFMYVNDTPLFSTFFIEMGRGNGKDGFMMPLMNFLQTPLYGIENYHIDIIANNEDQAIDSFDVVYDAIHDNPKFKGKFYVSRELIKNLSTNARLRYNTSNAKTKDGKKGGALLFNEYHAYETNDQINVFTSQRGKIRHPRTFIITTNGYVRGGPLDEMEGVCIDILKTGINDIRYFPFICRIDKKEEINDPKCWIKANPSIEYMPVLKKEIYDEYNEMKRFPSRRPEFITKRMNLPERDDEVTVASWENILRASYVDGDEKKPRPFSVDEGESAIVGIDYADIRDFVSAGILFKKDGEYIWRQHTWICRNSPTYEAIKFPFNRVGLQGFEDFEVIDNSSLSPDVIVDWVLQNYIVRYNVQKIVMDTYRFKLFRIAFEERGLTIESKSDPYGLVRMIRRQSSINTITAPLIEKAFADGNVNIGDSAIMRWYINNTSVKVDSYGNKQYGKIEPILRKNDGFMALVAAMSVEEMLDVVTIYV